MEVSDGSWWCVERVSSCAESSRGAWRRVATLMMVRFPREGRLAEEDLNGTCKNTIRARITAATVWQWFQDSEWRRLQVRNQRRWLKRVRGLTANGCSSSCKGRSNCESKIILMKTGLPRKSQQVRNSKTTTGRRWRFNGKRLQRLLWQRKRCWEWSNTNKDKTAKKKVRAVTLIPC